MTSQLNYLIAQQRQAELVSSAEQARLASESRLARRRHNAGTPRKLAPGLLRLCLATPPRVHMKASCPTPERVDSKELDEQVEGTYDHRFASENPRPAPPHADPLAETPGYPPLCAYGMNSLTDRGYDHALARLRRG